MRYHNRRLFEANRNLAVVPGLTGNVCFNTAFDLPVKVANPPKQDARGCLQR